MISNHGAVVIGTHFDDVALSMGGLLPAIDGPTVVVTVHGGPPDPALKVSGWDADCGFVSGAEAHAVRSAEDARACAILGAEQLMLPNPDGPYRAAADPFAGLGEVLRGLGSDVPVYLPLGTTQPDHIAVRDAALDILAGLGTRTVRIYADQPYAPALVPDWTSAPADEVVTTLARHDPEYRNLRDRYGMELLTSANLSDQAWSRKRDAVFCHASQLSLVGGMGEVRHLGKFLRHGGPLSREFVWQLGRGERP
ncbi:PIG-L deacetylase family protein [Actinoplanes sp. NPDC049599]|jgi:LmbE family N-acetylglucosaminyl deacetylase|uniref:PIG-L deacetylase family protein n=1 Tax=Actinoplanes sp. NPDC049599 TaxID=3363903 RepID=UPI0037A2BD69